MRFEKWTALGNDYLIVEAAALVPSNRLRPPRLRKKPTLLRHQALKPAAGCPSPSLPS